MFKKAEIEIYELDLNEDIIVTSAFNPELEEEKSLYNRGGSVNFYLIIVFGATASTIANLKSQSKSAFFFAQSFGSAQPRRTASA